VADTKRLIRDLARPVGPDAIDLSIQALVARWETEEARAGIRAFFEKTAPPWTPS
jgi:methylglutaconyl-CoA hydratase